MLKQLALDGSLQSQKRLAEIYGNGAFGEADFMEAFKWLLMAGEHGDAASQYHLGDLLKEGFYVPENSTEAVKWFRLAAEQEHIEAQERLAECYLDGYGVKKNEKEANRWFERAAKNGSESARRMLRTSRQQHAYMEYWLLKDGLSALLSLKDGASVEETPELSKEISYLIGEIDTTVLDSLGAMDRKEVSEMFENFRKKTKELFEDMPDQLRDELKPQIAAINEKLNALF